MQGYGWHESTRNSPQRVITDRGWIAGNRRLAAFEQLAFEISIELDGFHGLG